MKKMQKVVFRYGMSFDNDPELQKTEVMYFPMVFKFAMIESIIAEAVDLLAVNHRMSCFTINSVEVIEME